MQKSENVPLISVIVPVYRVEKYLERCIGSIVSQTYRNLEILLIDDGSPDRCPQICDAWAEKDPRVRVIHQENRGVSAARNAGVDAARGEFIGFVDGDDFILPEYFETLYTALSENRADLSMCKSLFVDEDGDAMAVFLLQHSQPPGVYSGRELLEQGLIYNVWGILFRADTCRERRFPENRIYGEDYSYICLLLPTCDRIAVSGKKLYHYTWREDGAVGQTRHALNEHKLIDGAEVAIELHQYFLSLDMRGPARIALCRGFDFVCLPVRRGFYFRDRNYRIVNHMFLWLFKRTVQIQKTAALQFFLYLIGHSLKRDVYSKAKLSFHWKKRKLMHFFRRSRKNESERHPKDH